MPQDIPAKLSAQICSIPEVATQASSKTNPGPGESADKIDQMSLPALVAPSTLHFVQLNFRQTHLQPALTALQNSVGLPPLAEVPIKESTFEGSFGVRMVLL
jgi:hypothetical protein